MVVYRLKEEVKIGLINKDIVVGTLVRVNPHGIKGDNQSPLRTPHILLLTNYRSPQQKREIPIYTTEMAGEVRLGEEFLEVIAA